MLDEIKKEDDSSNVVKKEDVDEAGPKLGEESVKKEVQDDVKVKVEPGDDGQMEPQMTVSDALLKEFEQLRDENKRLHDLTTDLHHKYHMVNVKVRLVQSIHWVLLLNFLFEK